MDPKEAESGRTISKIVFSSKAALSRNDTTAQFIRTFRTISASDNPSLLGMLIDYWRGASLR
jgi:hypothetical protein